MRPERIRRLLASVRAGKISVASALDELRQLPFEDLGFAKVDHHRELRTGSPEVIYGPGKTSQDLARIAQAVARRGHALLATRLSAEGAGALLEALPGAEHHLRARAVTLEGKPAAKCR